MTRDSSNKAQLETRCALLSLGYQFISATNNVQSVEEIRFPPAELHIFVARAMQAVGVGVDDAELVADLLIKADLRGIDPPGIARLERLYIDPVRIGRINPRASRAIIRRSAVSLVVDASNGLGHPASVRTVADTIESATVNGFAMSTVRNSNHHEATAYYAMMALPYNIIGIAATNSTSTTHDFAVTGDGRALCRAGSSGGNRMIGAVRYPATVPPRR